jgi:RNA polymerase sigma-70 factor (family 1)
LKPQFKDLPDIVRRLSAHSTESAYEELFHLLYLPVKKFALCMLHCNEEAEEVAGDVLVTLWRKRKSLQEIKNVYVYALVIAKNLSLNVIRKKSKSKITSLDNIDVGFYFDSSTPEQLIIDNELKRRIESAIQSLPPKCQLVFKLAKENRLSYKEIGEILSISPKTVDAHLVTATRKLAQIFKAEFQIK